VTQQMPPLAVPKRNQGTSVTVKNVANPTDCITWDNPWPPLGWMRRRPGGTGWGSGPGGTLDVSEQRENLSRYHSGQRMHTAVRSHLHFAHMSACSPHKAHACTSARWPHPQLMLARLSHLHAHVCTPAKARTPRLQFTFCTLAFPPTQLTFLCTRSLHEQVLCTRSLHAQVLCTRSLHAQVLCTRSLHAQVLAET
jgi:hypothetical protein